MLLNLKNNNNNDLPYPETIITDADSAEIKALKRIFPNTNHILCIFHVNNNILAKIKSKIKTEFNRENGYDSDDDDDDDDDEEEEEEEEENNI